MSIEENKALLRDYVLKALKLSSSKQHHYDSLVDQVRNLKVSSPHSAAATEKLANVLHAITSNVSFLNQQRHKALIAELLEPKLWAYETVVRTAALELICHLVVAHGLLAAACLELLCTSVVPPPKPPQVIPPEQLGTAWEPTEQEVVVQGEVVQALTRVLQLVPTSSLRISQLLLSRMPHKIRDRNAQCIYLRALFLLAEGASGASIRDTLLLGVVEHLLTIDVEIKWQDIADPEADHAEEEGASSSDEEQEVFELQDMTHSLTLDKGTGQEQREGWEGGSHPPRPADNPDTPATAAVAQPALDNVDVKADKLDVMMEMTLQHVLARCKDGQTLQVWATLVSAFEGRLIHVHRSKFTQFLVFLVASMEPAHCTPQLVELLLHRLVDARQPPITRSACAAYLASFLARAAYVPLSVLRSALQELVAWAGRYAESASLVVPDRSMAYVAPSNGMLQQNVAAVRLTAAGTLVGDTGAIAARHQVFYAIVQAVLYVLCYHLRTLLDAAKDDSEQRQGVVQLHNQLIQVLQSKLCPLQFCAPSVVHEFLVQTRRLGLQTDVLTELTMRGQQAATRPLEMFFPFDPFLLHRSAKLLGLKRIYIRWSSGGAHTCARTSGPLNNTPQTPDEEPEDDIESLSASDDDDDDVSDSTEASSSGNESDSDSDDPDLDHPLGASADMGMSPDVLAGAMRAFPAHANLQSGLGMFGGRYGSHNLHAGSPWVLQPAAPAPQPISRAMGRRQGGMEDSAEGTPIAGESASPYGKSVVMGSSLGEAGFVPMN